MRRRNGAARKPEQTPQTGQQRANCPQPRRFSEEGKTGRSEPTRWWCRQSSPNESPLRAVVFTGKIQGYLTEKGARLGTTARYFRRGCSALRITSLFCRNWEWPRADQGCRSPKTAKPVLSGTPHPSSRPSLTGAPNRGGSTSVAPARALRGGGGSSCRTVHMPPPPRSAHSYIVHVSGF